VIILTKGLKGETCKVLVVLSKELRTADGVFKVSSSRALVVEGSWVQDGMGF
jgi:hypothetical protein